MIKYALLLLALTVSISSWSPGGASAETYNPSICSLTRMSRRGDPAVSITTMERRQAPSVITVYSQQRASHAHTAL